MTAQFAAKDLNLPAVLPQRRSVIASFEFHVAAAKLYRRRVDRPDLGEPRPDLVRYHLIQAREMTRRIREGDFGPDREDLEDDDRGEVFETYTPARHFSGRPYLSSPCGDA